MQPCVSIFRRSLLCVVVLVMLPGLSWAASSAKGEASGVCCVKNSLKAATASECAKAKGKYYGIKDRVKAQKECVAKQPVGTSRSGKVIKPTASSTVSASGYCCVNGAVKKATKSQCSKVKGSYYTSSSQAKKACKPKKVFCCVNGKLAELSSAECAKRKGTPYTSAAQAKAKCKPADIYCHKDGKIKKTSSQQCKQYKGVAYKSLPEAKRALKAAVNYCCVDGKVIRLAQLQCQQRHGKSYASQAIADRSCRQEKGYCNVNGRIIRLSEKQCLTRKGTYFPKRASAEEQIRVANSTKGYCCSNGSLSRRTSQECSAAHGKYFTFKPEAVRFCKSMRLPAPAPPADEPAVEEDTSLRDAQAFARARGGSVMIVDDAPVAFWGENPRQGAHYVHFKNFSPTHRVDESMTVQHQNMFDDSGVNPPGWNEDIIYVGLRPGEEGQNDLSKHRAIENHTTILRTFDRSQSTPLSW